MTVYLHNLRPSAPAATLLLGEDAAGAAQAASDCSSFGGGPCGGKDS